MKTGKTKLETLIAVSFLVLLICMGCAKTEKEDILDPKKPVTITIWHYYSGAQQEAFNKLLTDYNQTEGKERGIIVKASGYGVVEEVADAVKASADRKAGAVPMPNIFATYVNTIMEIDAKDKIADLSQYLAKKEEDEYVDSFMEEGRLGSGKELKIFPIAKSTEVFMVNQTDWDKFAQATGAKIEDCQTVEGVTAVAKQYYEWTDSLTDTPYDGQAFYGRDAMANYFIIGSQQLGSELFAVEDGKVELHFDKEIIKKLWDNYYVPFVNGYFSAIGRFRSDDIKIGNIIALTGSSSGATFFPKEVVLGDTQSYPIEMMVLEAPQFQSGKKYAVQQGAGMAVTCSDKKKEYASVEFLKWFTDAERNVKFALNSGYLPVKKEANNIKTLEKTTKEMATDTVKVGMATITDNQLYSMKAFPHSQDARTVLEYSLSDQARQDRAVVIERIQQGMSQEEAVASFVTDENFDTWYQTTKTELEKLTQE
ncbi:MAG: extracellular solute-binding protein [Lachnospiraceae bacterium]